MSSNPFDDPRYKKWYYNPWFVLFMLLFVMGPFALPLLYQSPRFSLKWKIIWTVVTLLLLWSMIASAIQLYHLLKPMWESIAKAQAQA